MKWKITLAAVLLATLTIAAGAAQAMCVYNDKNYSPGARITVGDTTLECQKNGEWVEV